MKMNIIKKFQNIYLKKKIFLIDIYKKYNSKKKNAFKIIVFKKKVLRKENGLSLISGLRFF